MDIEIKEIKQLLAKGGERGVILYINHFMANLFEVGWQCKAVFKG